MKETDKLLLELLAVPSHSGQCERMIAFLQALFPEAVKDDHGNLFITQGKAPYACAVAHMDTVHRIESILPLQFPSIVNGIKTMCITGFNPETLQQTGIGGDDKCGVYACIKLLEYVKDMKVAFFVDEETGCIGSGRADINFFKDCRFILQADRRGSTDFVNSIGGAISSKEFQEAVKPLMKKRGFSFCTGMMTDVMKLNDRRVGVSCANLSAGYHRPHQDSEYIVVNQLENTIYLMWLICTQLVESYPFLPDEKTYPSYYNRQPSSAPYNRQSWEGEEYGDYWQHFKGKVDPPQEGLDKSNGKQTYHKWYKGVHQPVEEESLEEALEKELKEAEEVIETKVVEEEQTAIVKKE